MLLPDCHRLLWACALIIHMRHCVSKGWINNTTTKFSVSRRKQWSRGPRHQVGHGRGTSLQFSPYFFFPRVKTTRRRCFCFPFCVGATVLSSSSTLQILNPTQQSSTYPTKTRAYTWMKNDSEIPNAARNRNRKLILRTWEKIFTRILIICGCEIGYNTKFSFWWIWTFQ